MAKTAKTFRLSEQAVERLKSLHKTTGANETAIIEIALAMFQKEMERRAITDTVEVNSLLEEAEADFTVMQDMERAIQPPKRRKRRRRK